MPRTKTPPILNDKLVTALARGGLAPIIIGPFDAQTAIATRHRLYRERIKMRELKHPDTDAANQATIALRRTGEADQWNVIIYPVNLLIDQALERAGVTTGNPPPLE